MNKITALKRKQAQLEKLQKEVEKLEKQELAFASDLEKLLKKYGKTHADLARVGGGSAAKSKAAPVRKRKRRKLKVYVNPHTKEKVETRGGNHRILKAWKAEHGSDVVESWLKS